MPRFVALDPRRLWRTYAVALFVIFALVTFSHFAVFVVAGDGSQAARDINMSGRQRMLSQRILYFASAYAQSGWRDEALAGELARAIDLFASSHAELTSEEDRRLPRAVRRIYFGQASRGAENPGQALDPLSQAFARSAATLLDPSADRQESLDWMESIGPSTLLERLDDAVGAFEDAASAAVARGALVGYVGYGLAILALILEALLIFRPAHRTILGAIDELETSNADLKAQEREAFAALEEAEEAWLDGERARAVAEQAVTEAEAAARARGAELLAPLGTLAQMLAQAQSDRAGGAEGPSLLYAERLARIAHAMAADLASPAFAAGAAEGETARETAFDPRDLAMTVLSTLPVIAEGGGVTPHLDIREGDGAKIRADPVRLARLLLIAVGRLGARGDGDLMVLAGPAEAADLEGGDTAWCWDIRHEGAAPDTYVDTDDAAARAYLELLVADLGGTLDTFKQDAVRVTIPVKPAIVAAPRGPHRSPRRGAA